MSRNDLTPAAAAELAALDAILAGGPVSDDHLELAALVDSVRSVSPQRSDEFAARLDERFERRRAARTRRTSLRAPRAAWAGGSLIALVVAVAVVVGSGVLNGSKPALSDTPGHGRSAGPAIAPPGPAGGVALPRSSAGATSSGTAYGPTGATATTNPAFTLAPSKIGERNTNPSHRLVARGATLTLASPPAQMQTVANEVVSNTERLGGIVESSSVDVRGRSSYASFSLSVPSTHLPALISSLSSLAGVRALDQSSSDITDSYDQARTQLADEKAQRAALIKALAAAGSLSAEQAIQQRIDRLDSKIAAATRRAGALLVRGNNAKVAVVIVASAAAAASGSGGPVNRALNDALKVLDVALAIALVALAIALPIALVTLASWWAAATLRRRSRERVLEVSAAARP
jgi:hypothetical protein